MPRVLFIGDIVGRVGRTLIKDNLPELIQSMQIDYVIANGENSAGGSGITLKIAKMLHNSGIDAITLGDHVWDQRNFKDEINKLDFLCRPINLSVNAPGKSYLIINKNRFKLGIVTLLGRVFMKPQFDCPFTAINRILTEINKKVNALLVEIHAEATAEKVAMGWYLDGKVALVAGTHTHIPTADAKILPKGTGYITDVGMTGPYTSVLGCEINNVIDKFVDGIPRRFSIAKEDARICGCIADINTKTGLTEAFNRFEINNKSKKNIL